jgi:disulfide bond formation protein DsbB
MNPLRWSFRLAYLVGFLVCIALLTFAIAYAQLVLHLTPCNLCVLQRAAFIWMALWFLAGGLHSPRGGGRWTYAVLMLIGATFGVAIAVRQLWLQSLPADQIPACGAGFDLLLAQLKAHAILFSQFMTMMLRGSGDCARVTWRFLGLSMAGWTLIWYILLGIWGLLPRGSNRLAVARPPRTMRG